MLLMKKDLMLSLKSIFEVNWPVPTLPDPTWPDRPCPIVTLFDSLFLSQLKIYKFEILTQCGYRFQIVVLNFDLNFIIGFEIRAFLLKPVFWLVSYIFGYNSGTT